MSRDPRHKLGRTGERLAAEHFERRGFVILDQNYRTRWGELDLVAYDEERIVFCEVKTRRRGATPPLAGLRQQQRRRLRRMAAAWLTDRPARPRARELRFDALGITLDDAGRLVSLEHLEGAF